MSRIWRRAQHPGIFVKGGMKVALGYLNVMMVMRMIKLGMLENGQRDMESHLSKMALRRPKDGQMRVQPKMMLMIEQDLGIMVEISKLRNVALEVLRRDIKVAGGDYSAIRLTGWVAFAAIGALIFVVAGASFFAYKHWAGGSQYRPYTIVTKSGDV